MASMEMEDASFETMAFDNVEETRHTDMLFNHTEGGNSSARLNAAQGKVTGPSLSLQVKAGDTVRMEVHAKYLDKFKGSKTLPGVASLIAASLIAAPANEALNIVNELQSVLASGQVATFSDNDEIPKAYLQYLYFDNGYKFRKSGFRQVSEQGKGDFETLTLEHVAEEDGFMMMYVANETNEDLNVYFDDLTVVHSEGPVIRKDDYYPFGLSYNTSTLGGALTNKFLYNGKEFEGELGLNWNDFGARLYDPAVGRWFVVDPLADEPEQVDRSLYAAFWNNPIKYDDPDGRCPRCLKTLVKTVVKSIAKGKVDLGDVYDIVDAGATLIDPNSSAIDKGLAVFDILSPVSSKEFKAGAKFLGFADNANDAKKTTNKLDNINNPYGSKGKPDHQAKVEDLSKRAKAENPDMDIVTERKIQGHDSNRRPDVQVVDPQTGRATKVYEAERRPESTRNRTREAEYNRLNIPNETVKVGN